MTQNSFLSLIRQYAALAKRYNKSYAEPVNALVQRREDTIRDTETDAAKRDTAIAQLHDMTRREYGSVDRDFKIDTIPF